MMSSDPDAPPALSTMAKPTLWPKALPEPPLEHTRDVVTLRRHSPRMPCPAVEPVGRLEPHQVGSDVWVYPNIFPQDLCDHLITRFEIEPNKVRRPKQDDRRCVGIYITKRAGWEDEDKAIECLMGGLCAHYFKSIYGMDWSIDDAGYELGRYHPRDHRKPSFDHGSTNRFATVCVTLNDVERGGETVFIRQGIRVKPERGSAIVFPCRFTHPYYFAPTWNEPRYVLSTWLQATQATMDNAKAIIPEDAVVGDAV